MFKITAIRYYCNNKNDNYVKYTHNCCVRYVLLLVMSVCDNIFCLSI